jgi:hypothetical protein
MMGEDPRDTDRERPRHITPIGSYTRTHVSKNKMAAQQYIRASTVCRNIRFNSSLQDIAKQTRTGRHGEHKRRAELGLGVLQHLDRLFERANDVDTAHAHHRARQRLIRPMVREERPMKV